MKCALLSQFYSYLKGLSLPIPRAYLILTKDSWQREVALSLLFDRLCYLAIPIVKSSDLTFLRKEVEEGDLFNRERALFSSGSESPGKELQHYLTQQIVHPHPGLIFIIGAETVTSHLCKVCEERGVVFIPEKLKSREREELCTRWLINQASLRDKELSLSVAQLLVHRIGIDYYALKNELDKLIAHSGERRAVTEQDIAAVGQLVLQDNSWQIGELLLQRDIKGALALGLRLLTAGTPLLALVRQVRRQFQTSFEVATLAAEETSLRYPQLRGFMVERHQRLALHYGLAYLPSAMCAIDECELSFKNGVSDEQLLFCQLALRLIDRRPLQLKLPLGARYAF